jgi:ribokinase
MKSPGIVVVGSLNMDFVVSVKHLPAPGETILGHNFQMIPGGKGANQACAAGRLAGEGMRVRMIGRVGQDLFGDHLKASLSAAGVDVSAVHASRSLPTGVALIPVEASGQNSIIVASGANHDLAAVDVEAMRRVFRGAGVALFQLETPLDTVEAAMRLAREEGLVTILDPAPAQPLRDDLMALVDILTPNEAEALGLLGLPVRRMALEEAPGIAAQLRARGDSEIGRSGLLCRQALSGLSSEGRRHNGGGRYLQCGPGGRVGRRVGVAQSHPLRQRRGGDFGNTCGRAGIRAQPE